MTLGLETPPLSTPNSPAASTTSTSSSRRAGAPNNGGGPLFAPAWPTAAPFLPAPPASGGPVPLLLAPFRLDDAFLSESCRA